MAVGGRKGLGSTSSKRKGDGGGSRTNRVLAALILAAVVFSSTTMLLISPTITKSVGALDNIDAGSESVVHSRHQYQQQQQQPRQQHTDTDRRIDPQSTSPPPQSPESPPTNSRSTISDLVSWMLSENDKDARTQHAKLNRLADSPITPLEFVPGTLSLSHAQTLKHCYADPKIYGKHFQGGRGDGKNVGVSYSDKHKLAYVMLPKVSIDEFKLNYFIHGSIPYNTHT